MIVRSSSFMTFKECPKKAFFMYETGLVRNGGKSIDLFFGSVVHDAIDLFNKTGDIHDSDMYIDSLQWPIAKKKTPALAKLFIRLYRKKTNGANKIFSEREFQFTIGDHIWRGRWDGLTAMLEGILVDENKTTNWRFFIPKPNDQLTSYYKAARLKFGNEVIGILLNDFDVDKAEIKQQVIRFSDEEVSRWEKETINELAYFEKCREINNWPKRPSSCLLYGLDYPCPYVPLCQSPHTEDFLIEKWFTIDEQAKGLSW